jgi:hypothetical protein
MDFAGTILARLDELGLNIHQAETRAGFPVGYIRGCVRDDDKRATPNVEKAEAIARSLGLDFYIGPKRSELPPGFAEAQAEAVAMIRAQTLNDGYMVLPWHRDALRPGPTPLAFSRSWMQRQSLEPDTLCLVVPDQVRLPGGTGSPGDTVALIDTAAPRTAAPAPWAYLDRARVCLADVTRHGTVTVIRSGQRHEPDLILQGPESAAIRMLGRVLWWGTAEPARPSDK